MRYVHLSDALASRSADSALSPADACLFAEEFLTFSEEMEHEVNVRAWHLCMLTLAEIGRALTHHSSQSAAVAHALGLHEADGSLSKIGARLGISKQAVGRYVTGLRAVFAANLPSHHKLPVVERPTIAGRWLTRPEVHREFHIETKTAERLGCPTVEVAGIKFWNADELRRLLDERAQVEAERRLRRAIRRHEISPKPNHHEQ